MGGAYVHCRVDSMASQFPDVYAESASAILDFCRVRSGLRALIKTSEHTQNRNLDGNGEAL
jgi:hypothetical protein